jgi:hypothetical protein
MVQRVVTTVAMAGIVLLAAGAVTALYRQGRASGNTGPGPAGPPKC